VALVGVSQSEHNLGRRALRHLRSHGFEGRIDVVHPSAESIEGITAHRSLAELADPPDLAVVCTHGDRAIALVEDAVSNGARSVMVLASSGQVVESAERVREALARTGARMLGPNSPGFVSVAPPVAPHISHFLTQNKRLIDAPTAVIAQSGAVAGILANRLLQARVGFRWLICTGNEHDLGLGETLAFLATRELRAIGLFVESVRDIERFREGLDLAARNGVRVCAVKVGASEAGRRQAMTHTGALTGRSELFEQELARAGGRLCADLDELAACLAVATLPRPRLRSVAVAATSGGVAGLLGDRAAAAGIAVPELADLANPWDTDAVVMDDPEGCAGTWSKMLHDPSVGAGLLGFGALPDTLMHRLTAALASEPIAEPYVLVPAAGMPADALDVLRGKAVAIESTACAVGALAWAAEHAELPSPASGPDPLTTLLLDEAQAKLVLTEAGVAVPRGGIARSREEALALAGQIGAPIVLKCLRPAFAHKAAVGGVRLGVGIDRESVEAAWTKLSEEIERRTGRALESALVEEQLPGGLELLVSVGWEERHGAFLTVGSGGAGVEQQSDVEHRLLPTDRDSVEAAFAGLSIGAALAQAARLRGEDGQVPAELVDLALALARIAAAKPGVTVECNPVLLPLAAGPPVALDCVVVEQR
jgi:acyl-CoA synthetase (NDP forming)